MSSALWSVWSWDGMHGIWMEVAEGTQTQMAATLVLKQRAAAKHLPNARFTLTRKNQPPTEAPNE